MSRIYVLSAVLMSGVRSEVSMLTASLALSCHELVCLVNSSLSHTFDT